MRTVTMLALALALAAGCNKDKNKDSGGTGSATGQTTGSAGSGSATDSGSGSATGSATDSGSGSAAASGSGSAAATEVAMQRRAGKCPSTVLGAETKAEVKGKTVVLTITAAEKDAIAAIQKRTEELLEAKAAGGTSGATHDQKGSHGGGIGLCPVYWTEGGSATAKNAAKGVVVTITPKDKPEELAAIIDGRITKANDWVKANIKPGDQGNQGGVGGGEGDHGSTHQGEGDAKGKEREGGAREGGTGGGAGTGGGGGKGTGGGNDGKPKKSATMKKTAPATDTGGGW